MKVQVRPQQDESRKNDITFQQWQQLQVNFETFDFRHGAVRLPRWIAEREAVYDNGRCPRPDMDIQITGDSDSTAGLGAGGPLDGMLEPVPVHECQNQYNNQDQAAHRDPGPLQ